jgi:hypothetical protein
VSWSFALIGVIFDTSFRFDGQTLNLKHLQPTAWLSLNLNEYYKGVVSSCRNSAVWAGPCRRHSGKQQCRAAATP